MSFSTISGRIGNVLNVVISVEVGNNRHQRQMLNFQRIVRTCRLRILESSWAAAL